MLLAGSIKNWPREVGCRRGWFQGVDQSVFHQACWFPPFNRLFAALYNLAFAKMTNMSYLILTPSLTLKDIFTEKIYGTDKFLVVMVTQRQTHFLQWLKWLIYIAAFKDHCNVDHVAFQGCNKADPSRKPAMEGGFSTPRLMPGTPISSHPRAAVQRRTSAGCCWWWPELLCKHRWFCRQGGDRDDAPPQGPGSGARRRRASLTPGGRRRSRQQQLNIKAHSSESDLGWQSIAAERVRGEAKGFSLAQQAGARAAWQGVMWYIVTNMNNELYNIVTRIVTEYNITIWTYTMYNITHYVVEYCTICTILCNV